MSKLTELPIVDILNVGLSGFCFLIALLGYFLLIREQSKKPPREVMLEHINGFVKKILLLSLLVAAVTISLAFIQKEEPVDNGASIAKFISDLPEELRDENPTQVIVNIGNKVDLAGSLQAKVDSFQSDKDKFNSVITAKDSEITTLQATLRDKENSMSDLQSVVESKQKEIDQLKAKIGEHDSSILTIISGLNRDMVIKFGRSINPMYPFPISEKKREANKKIQAVLAELDFYEGVIDGDGESTRKALAEYKKTKGYTGRQLYLLTSSTTNKMIVDYVLNSE